MYRAVVHFHPEGNKNNPDNVITLRSVPLPTEQKATEVFDTLMANPWFIGGHVEQKVPNIGWVVCDEVESAVICRNRMMSDRDES